MKKTYKAQARTKENQSSLGKILVSLISKGDLPNIEVTIKKTLKANMSLKQAIEESQVPNLSLEKLTMLAIEKRNLEALKILTKYGANVRFNDDFALRWASTNGEKEIVSYLLEKKCNAASKNFASLRWAQDSNHTEITQLLLASCNLKELKNLTRLLEGEGKLSVNHYKNLLHFTKNELNKKLLSALSNKKSLSLEI
jgi:ankyrin repeat protein